MRPTARRRSRHSGLGGGPPTRPADRGRGQDHRPGRHRLTRQKQQGHSENSLSLVEGRATLRNAAGGRHALLQWEGSGGSHTPVSPVNSTEGQQNQRSLRILNSVWRSTIYRSMYIVRRRPLSKKIIAGWGCFKKHDEQLDYQLVLPNKKANAEVRLAGRPRTRYFTPRVAATPV